MPPEDIRHWRSDVRLGVAAPDDGRLFDLHLLAFPCSKQRWATARFLHRSQFSFQVGQAVLPQISSLVRTRGAAVDEGGGRNYKLRVEAPTKHLRPDLLGNDLAQTSGDALGHALAEINESFLHVLAQSFRHFIEQLHDFSQSLERGLGPKFRWSVAQQRVERSQLEVNLFQILLRGRLAFLRARMSCACNPFDGLHVLRQRLPRGSQRRHHNGLRRPKVVKHRKQWGLESHSHSR